MYFFGEFACRVTLRGETKKAKIYVLNVSFDLFGPKRMELFKAWNAAISVLLGNLVVSLEVWDVAERLKQRIAVKQNGRLVCNPKENEEFLTIKCKRCSNVDAPRLRIHSDIAGPLNGCYYLVVVDNISK